MKNTKTLFFLISLIGLAIFASCEKINPDDNTDDNPTSTDCFDYIDLAAHLESAGKTIFINANEGWVLGGESLIHTEDGGASWTLMNSEVPCAHEEIQFFNSTDGYLIDNSSGVQYTTDKGATWTDMVIPNPDNSSIDIHATASNGATTLMMGWIDYNHSALFIVENATHNVINTVMIPDMTIPGKKMYLSANGAINIAPVKRDGHDKKEIAYSSDNGATWTYTELDGDGEVQGNPWNSDISFPDDNTGYFAGSDNEYDKAYIYKTTNGGASWTKINIPASVTHYNFRQIAFADADHGLGIDLGIVCKTTDGGETWIQFKCFAEKYISTFSVSYPDATHGFITGLNGADADYSSRIYKYTDQ